MHELDNAKSRDQRTRPRQEELPYPADARAAAQNWTVDDIASESATIPAWVD